MIDLNVSKTPFVPSLRFLGPFERFKEVVVDVFVIVDDISKGLKGVTTQKGIGVLVLRALVWKGHLEQEKRRKIISVSYTHLTLPTTPYV